MFKLESKAIMSCGKL